ncbi:MAG: LGFP repeat-containing protein, partial [Mycobacterium sp.]
SRNSTFSASDKPVIFWTPEHGAFVVRGAINAAWDKLGSSGGVLGVPVGDETYAGEAATQEFSGGRVSWNRLTKAFATVPPELAQQLTAVQVPIDPTAAINVAWRAAGGASGPLGIKQGGQYPVGDDGLAQNFIGGKIFFSPATGANALESDVLAKYESQGGPVGSDLGFPTANEADGGIEPASRVATFSAADKPVIFWTSDHGAFVVRGAINAAWDKLGGPKGKVGPPVGDQTVDGDVVAQKFAAGQIAWDQAENTFSTEPANLASSLSGLQVPGQKMPARSAPTAGTGRTLAWHWWWLLGGIPVLLLIGMVVLLAPRRRRRRAGRRDTAAYVPDPDEKAGYDAVTESVSRWSPDTDRDLARSRLSYDHLEPPRRPHTVGMPPEPGSEWMSPVRTDLADDTLTDDALADEIGGAPELSDLGEDVDADPDAVDTAPTRVPSEAELRAGRHAAAETADDDSYFAAAAPRAAGQLAIHLPLDDPYQVPEGYPVKANASFGLYYMPD